MPKKCILFISFALNINYTQNNCIKLVPKQYRKTACGNFFFIPSYQCLEWVGQRYS